MLRKDRGSLATIAATIVCVVAIGVSATVLDASLAAGVDNISSRTHSGSGISLLALILLLLSAILSLFGIEFHGFLATGDSGSIFRLLTTLLSHYIEYLPLFFTVIAAVIAVAVAVRYSETVTQLQHFETVAEWTRNQSQEQNREHPATNIAPSNEVSRVWLDMVHELSTENPRSRTPHDWATAAVDAGFDPDAVDTLTRHFEEVRYGDGVVTQKRKSTVHEAQQRLDSRTKEDST